jgi:hypothetical protein
MAFEGIVTESANVVPDMKDPAYAKYARAQHESRFKVEKRCVCACVRARARWRQQGSARQDGGRWLLRSA